MGDAELDRARALWDRHAARYGRQDPFPGRNAPVASRGHNDAVHSEPTPAPGTPEADTEPEIRTLGSSVVYADDWISIRKDEIERLDGSRGTYAVVDKRDFALVIPAENGGFHLVEEYRYPLGRRGWSFPQGGFPGSETGTPEELARLELTQETGLRAARMTHLGTLAAGHGTMSQYCEYFLATGLTPGQPDLEPEELGLLHEWLPRDRFEQMISDGLIVDDSTVSAYALLLLAEGRGEVVIA